jgi:hypothetical protein
MMLAKRVRTVPLRQRLPAADNASHGARIALAIHYPVIVH